MRKPAKLRYEPTRHVIPPDIGTLMNTSKIISADQLETWAADLNARDGKIVVTYGRYDTLHIGHIRHLRQAREMGTVLVVVPLPDPSVPESLQAETLTHLDCVDAVLLGVDPGEALRRIHPAVCAVSGDEDGDAGDGEIANLCARLDIPLKSTPSVDFGSTLSINRFLTGLGEDVHEYLNLFRSNYSREQVESIIEAMGQLKVAVIGDTILDEYCYCDTLGVSSKDPILALRYRASDLFAGGIVAVANHVSNFAGEVRLFTVLGEQDSRREFVESRLNPGIRPHFAMQEGAPTVRKRRYLEGYTQNKLLEIYYMEDVGLSPERDKRFREAVAEAMPDCDLVIAADFGHGAVSPAMRRQLEKSAPYLAVNAQANSGNRGFHTISKFSRADYVSIAEHEMRLEMRDMRGPVGQMIDTLAPRLKCPRFAVTRGKRGSTIRCEDGRHITVPAFAGKIVDRIGAGDAFLSVTAMAAKLNAPPELVCFIGNVVGALAVGILGNQKSIDKQSVEHYVASLLG